MCNEHQYADIHLQGETVEILKSLNYPGLTYTDDADSEVTHGVQSGWKNWTRVSGVLCETKINVKINGRCT